MGPCRATFSKNSYDCAAAFATDILNTDKAKATTKFFNRQKYCINLQPKLSTKLLYNTVIITSARVVNGPSSSGSNPARTRKLIRSPNHARKKAKVKFGLKNLAMLSSYFDYIFVHPRQKVRFKSEISPKVLSTLSPNQAQTRTGLTTLTSTAVAVATFTDNQNCSFFLLFR